MLSDIENLDIMLGENHFSTRERKGSLNSNLPRDLEALQAMNLKMRTETWVEIGEILIQGQIPNVTAIQLQAIPVLR